MTRILVIEDEPLLRENITDILKYEGFEVADARNGVVGLDLAKTWDPDLIVCDVMMPDLDGYEVVKALRQSPETATIPFIFLTAKSTKADFRQGMIGGADDYLTKPFTALELVEAITTQLTKRAAITEKYRLQQQQVENRFYKLLHFDTATGLANKFLLRQQFNQLVKRHLQNPQPILVLCLVLQQFDRLTSVLEGDLYPQFLQQFVARLQQSVQSWITLETITRFSENQFIIFLTENLCQTGKEIEAEIAHLADLLLHDLTQPFEVGGQRLYPAVGIGMSIYPHHGTQVEGLVHKAELAVQSIPRQQMNAYQVYTPDLSVRSREQLMLENDLRAAWEDGYFQVYYQPQICVKSGRITGAEALIRCSHPAHGLISPAKFIPLAEETGLIIPIGEWVARRACKQANQWRIQGQLDLRISVNLSPRQLNHPNLEAVLLAVLEDAQLPPDCLELEITESCVMEDLKRAIATLQSLQNYGIHIALDDFGTGYSSLGYLRQLPLNTLKIDRSFITNIQDDPQNREIVKNIIQMAHTLGLKTVAEGVETQAEVDYLKQQGCDELQGYFFSRPVPPPELDQILRNWKGLPTPLIHSD